jgi:hypothetical protein
MPARLKSAPDGRIKVADCSTTGQLAVILNAACSTVQRLIDGRELPGSWVPAR